MTSLYFHGEIGKTINRSKAKVGRFLFTYLWIVAGVVLLLIVCAVILAMCSIHMTISFDRRSGDESGEVRVEYLFGLLRRTIRLTGVDAGLARDGSLVRAEHQNVEPQGRADHHSKKIRISDVLDVLLHWQYWLQVVYDLTPLVLRSLSHVVVSKFKCHLLVGTGEVVTSGLVNGSLWATLYTMTGFLSHHCQFETNPDISVQADFQHPILESSVECIIRIRAGQAIIAAVRLNRAWKRRTKYGSPHSGSHANSDGKYTGNG